MKRYNTIYKQHLADEDSVECKSELDQYLLEACEDLEKEDFDILDWWRVNSSRYKVIFQVARDVLAIPMSTIAYQNLLLAWEVVYYILSGVHCLLKLLKI